ncbi:unnamed protein product [Caenorhabditis bovis]|uniref:DUF19 domain-containing protein n=1 Tax=Caenorhabditis bovis TaxID=2654633 RepID=A0A8S1F057_9PELO|nr:unnamed protein product [Caenorhabditis bovis]
MRTLLVAVLLAATVSCQDLSCVDAKFQGCQYTLAQQIGLNDTVSAQLFKDYTIMYNYFLYMWGKTPGSTVDMLTVCNGLETFNLCMHGNKGCLDVSNLIKKTDINDAYGVDATYKTYLQFNCGPGINTLLHEGLTCPQRVIQNKQNVLQACVKTYELNVANDAKKGCKYGQDLMNCWSAPFAVAPCRREEGIATWWACEANRVFVKSTFPSCQNTCSEKFGPFSGEHANYLSTHHKIVDGEHWFKISDRVELQNGKLVTIEGEWLK